MSEPRRICLVGGSGLIGTATIKQSLGRDNLRLVALSRREFSLPHGARMEVLVAETEGWAEALALIKPDVVICALGTTRAKTGGDEEAFRAVDFDLVLQIAKAAKSVGVKQFILVSSVGANAMSQSFYLRVKGETETALGKLGLSRLDIIQPGLLRGKRQEWRLMERLAMFISPLLDLFLLGKYRNYRSIRDDLVAQAILRLSREKAEGKFTHTYDAILRAAKRVA